MITYVILAVLCGLTLLAYRYGGEPERMVALLLLATDLADDINHWITGPSNWVNVEPVHLVLDSLTLIGAFWVALRANRVWPLPIASLQLIVVTGHVSVYSPLPGYNKAYWAINTIPGWLQMAILLVGIAVHARRTVRVGRYRDWRHGLTAFGGKLQFAEPPRSYA